MPISNVGNHLSVPDPAKGLLIRDFVSAFGIEPSRYPFPSGLSGSMGRVRTPVRSLHPCLQLLSHISELLDEDARQITGNNTVALKPAWTRWVRTKSLSRLGIAALLVASCAETGIPWGIDHLLGLGLATARSNSLLAGLWLLRVGRFVDSQRFGWLTPSSD
jgi:hypothetical protein